MKQSLCTLGVVGFCFLASSVYAQTGQRQQAPPSKPAGAMMGDPAVEKAIQANETKINDAWTKKDVKTMQSMIADDAFGVDPMGANPVSAMYAQMPTMDVKVTNMKLSGWAFHWLDMNNVIVTYTWTASGTVMGQPVPSPTYASTAWTKRNGKWVAVFHQETAAMPMPKK